MRRRMKKEVSWWIGREWRGLIHQRFQWGSKTIWGKLTKLNGERVETSAQNKSPWQDLGGFRSKWQMCNREEGPWGWGGQGTERLGCWMVIHVDPEVTWFRGQRKASMNEDGRKTAALRRGSRQHIQEPWTATVCSAGKDWGYSYPHNATIWDSFFDLRCLPL